VAQIDPVTNHVVRNIPVGNGPVAVVATTEAIWVANQFDDTVWRLNPVSGRPVAKIAVGDAPSDLAVVDGSIWVTSSGSATAARIDIGTNQVTGVFGIGNGAAAVGGTGGAGGAVWVANDLDGTVERIDPATGVTRSVEPTGDGPVDLVATGGDVWVTNQHGGTLTRLDGTTGHVSQRIDVGGAPHGVAMVGGRLWVSTGAGPAVTHRGGTLNVLTDGEDNGIDPAMDYAAMMSLVYDGLVALRRTGGASGLTVVPDLATTIPRPSDDGLTYVFTVRRGIRYSDGEMVRPSDIRRGLERNLANRPNSYYANIRGAATCLRSPKPKTCDLTSGVDADDDNYTLTIQLTAPDPDLLAKLSVPFASATAPGAAAVETGRRPLPGTGPYQIKSYTPGPQGSIILVRNPNYREWSWAARPDGFADAITFRFLDHGTEAAVDTGRADVAPISDQEVAVRHRSQVHVSPGSLSFFVFFDTTRPPFNDVRVRQAVNYAIDRRQALAAFGGQISCQVLPPGYPGYQPSCPYTLAPGTQWSAPDLPRAMSLVAASGATGRHVELRAPKVLESLTSTVLTALRRLGFVASLRIVDDDTFFENIETRRATPALGLDGWGTDYPAASGYLGALLSCRGPENAALFCDPRVDRQMRRAAALETSAPAAADAAWADVERVVMTASPVAPLLVETRTIYVSPRLGNYQDNPIEGPLYDQMWVR
jgi:peptide/nickel transport system substrate-binding protein